MGRNKTMHIKCMEMHIKCNEMQSKEMQYKVTQSNAK